MLWSNDILTWEGHHTPCVCVFVLPCKNGHGEDRKRLRSTNMPTWPVWLPKQKQRSWTYNTHSDQNFNLCCSLKISNWFVLLYYCSECCIFNLLWSNEIVSIKCFYITANIKHWKVLQISCCLLPLRWLRQCWRGVWGRRISQWWGRWRRPTRWRGWWWRGGGRKWRGGW